MDYFDLEYRDGDPETDSYAPSDAGSYYSAESGSADEGAPFDETASPSANGEDPYFDAAFEAALSQMSMEELEKVERNDNGAGQTYEDDANSMAATDVEDSGNMDPSSSAGFGLENDRQDAGAVSRTPLVNLEDLTPSRCVIIAHSSRHVGWFDKHDVPWSAQWQIAFLLSNGRLTWDDITEEHIRALSGTNALVGPNVSTVLSGRGLDLEEAALDKGTLETLGLRPPSSDDEELAMGTWWGGKVEQRAVLSMIISKWSARFTLGLSTSQPTILFQAPNIHFIPDIREPSLFSRGRNPSDGRSGPSKQDAEGPQAAKSIMTDGCGLINRAALLIVQKRKKLLTIPTALQGRIAGAKGLWILNTTDQSGVPRIWITESQVKIKYTDEELEEDPSRRIFDLLRIAQVKTPVRLSSQPIINFAHNGVPNTVFSELLQESLQDTVDDFLNDWKANNVVSLWQMVYKRGVAQLRRERSTKLFERTFANFWDTEDDDEPTLPSHLSGPLVSSEAPESGPDPNSLWPTGLGEQIVELLESGFTPSSFTHLASLMKRYLKQEVSSMTINCHIPIRRSAEAFAAPDFTGTLKPGEVFFRPSQECELLDESELDDGIRVARGRMIIFRYPIRTPSDAQLVKAVDYPNLHPFTDVLLFSVLGGRSGASMLAGGDYDGDTIHMITEPRLVNAFRNSDEKYADPPKGFEDYVERRGSPAQEVAAAMTSWTDAQRVREFQLVLMDSVSTAKLCGQYSVMIDISTYMFGYGSDMAHYSSYMFSNELDGQKSGLHVKPEIWSIDRAFLSEWNQPLCMRKVENGGSQEKKEPIRPWHLGQFVLDSLDPFAQEQQEHYSDLIDKFDATEDGDYDSVLAAPFHKFELLAKKHEASGDDGMRKELERLKSFVEENRKRWAGIFSEQPDYSSQQVGRRLTRMGSSRSQITPTRDRSKRKDLIRKKREIVDDFWNGFEGIEDMGWFTDDGARLAMGSYAYLHAFKHAEKVAASTSDSEKPSLAYAFVVAFSILKGLKQAASPGLPFDDLKIPRRNIT
ncbi:hypothetical protein FRB90_012456 [Tulasnella sp. 427]|nr:hypothetical protein FRB90_012456 [Tulasnella sp. 427]